MTLNRARMAAKGFTLMELLIVIVIMGLLVSLVAPSMFSKVSSSKIKTTQAQMQLLATALDVYRLDVGSYPAVLDELRGSDKPGWDGPYLQKALPLDPWNHGYVYSVPGSEGEPYSLLSLGADGTEEGEGEAADIIYR